MNSSEFLAQISRLRDRYGEKAYAKDFSQLLWNDIQTYPDGMFTKAVNEIISEQFKPVGKNTILEIMRRECRAQPGVKETFANLNGCDNCHNSGVVMFYDSSHRNMATCCESCSKGHAARLGAYGSAKLPSKEIATSLGFKFTRSGAYPIP